MLKQNNNLINSPSSSLVRNIKEMQAIRLLHNLGLLLLSFGPTKGDQAFQVDRGLFLLDFLFTPTHICAPDPFVIQFDIAKNKECKWCQKYHYSSRIYQGGIAQQGRLRKLSHLRYSDTLLYENVQWRVRISSNLMTKIFIRSYLKLHSSISAVLEIQCVCFS